MKKRFIYITAVPVLVMFIGIFTFMLLPYLSDLYLLPRLIKELPFADKEMSISRISPWRLRGTVTFTDQDQHVFSIPRFELHYTPADLIKGKISRLLIDSATLHVALHNGKPVISGVAIDSSVSAVEREAASRLMLPVAVETLIVKNSTVIFHRSKDETFAFMVQGSFTAEYLEQSLTKKIVSAFSGNVLISGDMALKGRIEAETVAGAYEVNIQVQAPDIGQLAPFFKGIKKFEPTGELTLNSRVKIEKFKEISSHETTLKLARFRCGKDSFRLANSSAEKPVLLHMTGDMMKTHYTLNNIDLTGPEVASLTLEGDVALLSGEFTGAGNVYFERTASPVKIGFSGNNGDSNTEIHAQIQSDTFTLADNLSISSLTMDGVVNIQGAAFSGYLNGHIPKVVQSSSETALVGLSLRMPFHYPLPEAGSIASGSVGIAEIQHRGVNSGNFQASVTPSLEGVNFTTLFTTPFHPDLQVPCNGALKLPGDFSLHCRISETEIDQSVLPPFLQLPEEVFFTGILSAESELYITGKEPSGTLSIIWHDGTVTYNETTLSEINCDVDFPSLPDIQSSPSQLCTIGSLDFGNIHMSDAQISFRIEDHQTVFLEKSKLKWCGGRVEVGSVRLTGTLEELETTLYCDRLSFTELLGQFSIEDTEGQGTLNGRLPVLINSQGLRFDDGFLFSTPGNSGIVRFGNTQQLRQGMPDVNQAAYLDYSIKALENFSYNWTKLYFNTQDDDLLITMQLDGKPVEPLPFGYKNGHIIPASQGPGLQHPIRLDVNFHLPLKDLFQYGKNIQSIMENM